MKSLAVLAGQTGVEALAEPEPRRFAGARVTVVDNYDSFTYNLVQYLGELGATVTVHRNDAVGVSELERSDLTHLVVSPGPCTPVEAGVSVAAIRALAGRVPILGVCLGHQAIAHALGATIVRAPAVQHGKAAAVRHDGAGVFAGLADPLTATRYHSLVVDPATLPAQLAATAWADGPPAGTPVLMGLRGRAGTAAEGLEGVQFHPESILTLAGRRLLANFLAAGAGAPA